MGLMVAAVLALVVAASAQAAGSQSMVYIANGNVFIANADGSSPHQVTTNGKVTAGIPVYNPSADQTAYHSPTEASDGTIVAAMGYALYHFSQNGTLLKEIVPSNGVYPLNAAVSPDDTKIAYNDTPPVLDGNTPSGEPESDITPVDGSASGYPSQDRVGEGRWIDNSSLALATFTGFIDYQIAGQSAVNWFAPPVPDTPQVYYNHYPVVSNDRTYVADVLQHVTPSNQDLLQIYTLPAGPLPATQPVLKCQLTPLNGDVDGINEPSFSPDDQTIIWYDSQGEEQYSLSSPNCNGGVTLNLTSAGGASFIAGISQASFGTAANDPAPLPTPTAPPSSTPPAKTAPVPTFSAASLSIGTSLKKAALLKTGIKATLHCNAACVYAVALGVNNAAARKLGLTKKKKGAVAVGARTGRFRGGTVTVTVKLYAKALRALRRSRFAKLSLIVAVAAKGADGKLVDHTYGVTIRR